MRGSANPSLWHRWAQFTCRYPRTILGVVLAATLFFTYSLSDIVVSSDERDFMRTESRDFEDTLANKFELGHYHALFFETQSQRSLLEPALLHQQLKILQQIKQRFNVNTDSLIEGIDEGLKRVKRKSLLDSDDFTPVAEALLALSGPQTVRDLEKFTHRFTFPPDAIHFYAKLRVAARLVPYMAFGGGTKLEFGVPFVKAIMVRVTLPAEWTTDQRKEVLAQIRDLTDAISPEGLKVYHLSDEMGNYDIDVKAQQNVSLMGLFMLGIDALLLWGIFRSRREVLVSLFIVVTASLWTYGAASLLGFRISFLELLVLPILLGTGIDDSVVFGCRLADERAKRRDLPEAIAATFAATGTGIFLTTCTTFLAFLFGALTASTTSMRSFCLLVSLSMVVVFLLTVLLQGALRVIRDSERESRKRGDASAQPRGYGQTRPTPVWLHGFARLGARWVRSQPQRILVYSGLVVLVALVAAFELETEFSRKIFLRRTMPTYQAVQLHEKYFGRYGDGYVLIEGNVENPLVLEKIRRLEARLDLYPLMDKILGKANVSSINELIDKMKIQITPTMSVRSVLDRVTSSTQTADYVFNMSFQQMAQRFVHKSEVQYDGFLIHFSCDVGDGKKARALIQNLEQDIHNIGFDQIPGIRARVGGGALTFHYEAALLFQDFIKMFFWSLLVNFLALFVVWRRFWSTLLAMFPILFSVVLTLGLMSVLEVPLNVLSLCMGIIVVGLGIDYPIHIIERFKEEKTSPGSGHRREPLSAMQAALNQMGPGLWGSCLTTIMGFCASLILAMPIAESFGLIVGLALFLTYLASILVLPVLLVGPRLLSKQPD